MVNITKVWLATLNRDQKDSGIDDNFLNLTVNIDGEDRYENNYRVSSKRGCGALAEGFAEPVIELLFDSDSLTNSSIRLGMRGDDAWGPEHILVLGTTAPSEGPSEILPLAIEVDEQITVSTDPTDASPTHLSLPVRIIRAGNPLTVINRVLLLLQTNSSNDSGTDDSIEFEITVGGVSVARWESSNTPQDDFETGATNWYFVDVNTPFNKDQIRSNGKITMTIKGTDAWNPKRIFVYGFDTAQGRPTQIVDLVSFPNWDRGMFSKDPSEGEESKDLPLS